MKLVKSAIKINIDKSELAVLMQDAKEVKDIINSLPTKEPLGDTSDLFAFCCEIENLKHITNNFSVEVNNLDINFDFERLKLIYTQFIKVDKYEENYNFDEFDNLFALCLIK